MSYQIIIDLDKQSQVMLNTSFNIVCHQYHLNHFFIIEGFGSICDVYMKSIPQKLYPLAQYFIPHSTIVILRLVVWKVNKATHKDKSIQVSKVYFNNKKSQGQHYAHRNHFTIYYYFFYEWVKLLHYEPTIGSM